MGVKPPHNHPHVPPAVDITASSNKAYKDIMSFPLPHEFEYEAEI